MIRVIELVLAIFTVDRFYRQRSCLPFFRSFFYSSQHFVPDIPIHIFVFRSFSSLMCTSSSNKTNMFQTSIHGIVYPYPKPHLPLFTMHCIFNVYIGVVVIGVAFVVVVVADVFVV